MQIKLQSYSILFLGFFLMLAEMNAQNGSITPESVGKSRTGVTLAYKPFKALELSLEEQIRFKTIGKAYDKNLLQLSVDYELLKNMKIGAAYRYTSVYDDEGKLQGTKIRHRLHYRASYKYDINRSEFSIRGQYQHRREQGIDGIISEWENPYWRLKFGFEQNFRNWKLDPELGVEFFNKSLRTKTEEDNNYRLSFGSTYRLPGPHEIKFKYMYENGVGISEQIPTHIIAINYIYTIEHDKK